MLKIYKHKGRKTPTIIIPNPSKEVIHFYKTHHPNYIIKEVPHAKDNR